MGQVNNQSRTQILATVHGNHPTVDLNFVVLISIFSNQRANSTTIVSKNRSETLKQVASVVEWQHQTCAIY